MLFVITSNWIFSDVIFQVTLIFESRPGAIPTPESESKDDSDSGVGIGIICS